MAGRRKDTGKPLRRELQAQRARARLVENLAATEDPLRRMRHAFDYLHTAIAHGPDRDQLAAELVAEFTQRADTLWQERVR